MSLETIVGICVGIVTLLGIVFGLSYRFFSAGVKDEIYKVVDSNNQETFDAQQQIRIDMSALIERRLIETEAIREKTVTLMRKNDSDKLESINFQVAEMRLVTEKQLAGISVDIKVMSSNMAEFSNKLVQHEMKIQSIEKDLDKKENKK